MCLNPHTKIWRRKKILVCRNKNGSMKYSYMLFAFIFIIHCNVPLLSFIIPSWGNYLAKNRIFFVFFIFKSRWWKRKAKKIVFLCSLSSSQCTREASRRKREMRAIICVLKQKWQCGEAVRILKNFFFCADAS